MVHTESCRDVLTKISNVAEHAVSSKAESLPSGCNWGWNDEPLFLVNVDCDLQVPLAVSIPQVSMRNEAFAEHRSVSTGNNPCQTFRDTDLMQACRLPQMASFTWLICKICWWFKRRAHLQSPGLVPSPDAKSRSCSIRPTLSSQNQQWVDVHTRSWNFDWSGVGSTHVFTGRSILPFCTKFRRS